jgi:hypothetical protein
LLYPVLRGKAEVIVARLRSTWSFRRRGYLRAQSETANRVGLLLANLDDRPGSRHQTGTPPPIFQQSEGDRLLWGPRGLLSRWPGFLPHHQ